MHIGEVRHLEEDLLIRTQGVIKGLEEKEVVLDHNATTHLIGNKGALRHTGIKVSKAKGVEGPLVRTSSQEIITRIPRQPQFTVQGEEEGHTFVVGVGDSTKDCLLELLHL